MIEKLIETSPGTLVALTAILCATVFLVVSVVAVTWYHLHVHARDVELKREMLTRGMSVGDIERLVWVSSTSPPKGDPGQSAERVSDNEHALIEKMLDDGWEMEDIERLVRALKSGNTPRPETGLRGGFLSTGGEGIG